MPDELKPQNLYCVVKGCRRLRLPSGVVSHPPVCVDHYRSIAPESLKAIRDAETALARIWNDVLNTDCDERDG